MKKERHHELAVEHIGEETTEELALTLTDDISTQNWVMDMVMVRLFRYQQRQGSNDDMPLKKLDRATMLVYVWRVWSRWDPDPPFTGIRTN